MLRIHDSKFKTNVNKTHPVSEYNRKVKVGNGQEMGQSERNIPTPKTEVGKN